MNLFIAINISEEKPVVVDNYYTGIPVFNNKEDLISYLKEEFEFSDDADAYSIEDFQIVELTQQQFEIADLICLFFNNEKSADFILNLDKIEKRKIETAYHNKQVFENKYSIDAVELFDDFLAEIDICKRGEFTSRFIEERDAEPQKDVFASIYEE